MSAMRRLGTAGLICAALAGCSHTDNNPVGPANLIAVSGEGQFALPGAAVPESLAVQAVDDQNVGVAGVAITWTVVTGGGLLHPAAASSDANGRLAARWILGSLGPNVVTAKAGQFTVTFHATATGTPPSKLALITQPATGQSGVGFSTQPIVEIQSGSGTPVPQAGVTITASIATGSSFAALGGGATAVTAANGRASFSGLKITGPVGTYTLRFSASGLTPAVGGSIDLTTASGRIPLIDMGNRTYLGFTGGLFNGSNGMPAAHAAAGAARARAVKRLDLNGNPSPTGKIVLLSVGFSNPSQEWCDVLSFPCNSWSFTGQATADPAVNHAAVAIVNGALGGETAEFWRLPTDADYDRVKDSVLTPLGFSEAQVQVIWLKTANPDPTISLPDPQGDAIRLVTQNGDILRAMKVRYPNLQMVFMSSRVYAGYANTGQNPEPYAYETGFAVKWTVQAQIDQMANGGTIVDARAGDLDYTSVAPWVSWGPYLWADGLNPRSDGLTWAIGEFEADGTHPGTGAETKVGTQLLNFFKTDPHTSCWFLSGQTCP
ncbi:MAG TPA: carboxypeptidase-like regulatory domain-containing protein [Gemmatimonadales bacterium]|nr:carboxypeptidase-like regulatory domain-containing protein [Gemmatimonadales bacterium]